MTSRELHSRQIQLLTDSELQLRLTRLKDALRASDADSALISDNATIFYLTGRVFVGYVYIHIDESLPYYIVRRPNDLYDKRMIKLHRFAQLVEFLTVSAPTIRPRRLGLALNQLPYSVAERIITSLPSVRIVNISPAIAQARCVKTDFEITLMRESGRRQARVYQQLPGVYQEGMTDIELQIETERLARLDGCLGIFRVNGQEMEIFMGNVLTGDNADTPSPYDFAMGGAGLDPSLPVGADGTIITPRDCVMVDLNGNYTGYMTDMTRCFAIDPKSLAPKALGAHQLSIDIVEALTDMARPGIEAKELYAHALEMVKNAGMAGYFMGHHSQAGFVGHGVGIEINELPVLAPRSANILQEGNTIALEPKFVIPGTGPVGIEDTIVVRADGPAECITPGDRSIVQL